MRLFHQKALFAGLLVTCGAYINAEAWASDTPMTQRNRELSVTSRSAPPLYAIGIPVGRFNFYPSLTTDAEYTDNLYSSETTKLDDYILTLKPNFSFKSDFDRHALNVNLQAEKTFHDENSGEDYLEYGINTNARYDIGSEISIPLDLSYKQDTTERGSPDEEGALEPTEFEVIEGKTGFIYDGQYFNFDILTGLSNRTYDDTLTGIGIRNNSDRDRLETTVTTRLGLSSKAGIIPYIYGEYREINYDDALDDNGFSRNSDEYEAGVGARFGLSSLAESRIQVGYTNYEQEDPRFDDINDYNFLININWEPTTLMALSLSGERNVEETSLSTFSSSVDSGLKLAANYELTPTLFFKPRIEFLSKDYESTANLERFTYGLNASYRMNENLWWSAGYEYITQDDPDNSPFISEYERNNFLISLRLQL